MKEIHNSTDAIFVGDEGAIYHKDKVITNFEGIRVTEWTTYKNLGVPDSRSEPIKYQVNVELEGVLINEDMMILLGYEKTKVGYRIVDTSYVNKFCIKALGKIVGGRKADGIPKVATAKDVVFISNELPLPFHRISLKGDGTSVDYSRLYK